MARAAPSGQEIVRREKGRRAKPVARPWLARRVSVGDVFSGAGVAGLNTDAAEWREFGRSGEGFDFWPVEEFAGGGPFDNEAAIPGDVAGESAEPEAEEERGHGGQVLEPAKNDQGPEK